LTKFFILQNILTYLTVSIEKESTMKKFGLAVVVFCLLLPVVTFAAGSGEKENAIKIGFIGPLTGDAANYGKLMTQAVKIAVEERNAKGGIGGVKVVFLPEDSEGKPEKANAAIEKLASVDKIYGLIGGVFSGESLAIAPRCEAEKILMISPSATHKDLTNKGDYIFRDVPSDALQATVFAKYVREVMGLSRVAILYIKNDYSQGLSMDFKSQFEADGGTIVGMETGLQGDKDFKTQLTKIKALNPEALFIPNYVAEIAQILEQAKQLGLNTKMLSADGFSNPEILELAGDLANGVIFSGPEKEDPAQANAKTAAFEKKYEEKWGEKPDSFSLNAYDGANLIMDAIQAAYDKASDADKKALNLDRSLMQKYVAGIKGYMGVSGEITFAPNGDVIKNQGILTAENRQYKQIGVYRIESGKLVKVK